MYDGDAILLQSQLKYGSKDQFTKRFSLHLSNTIAAVKNIPADAQVHHRNDSSLLGWLIDTQASSID